MCLWMRGSDLIGVKLFDLGVDTFRERIVNEETADFVLAFLLRSTSLVGLSVKIVPQGTINDSRYSVKNVFVSDVGAF